MVKKLTKRGSKRLNYNKSTKKPKKPKKSKKTKPKSKIERKKAKDGSRIMIGPKRKPIPDSDGETYIEENYDSADKAEYKGYTIIDVHLSDEENKGTLASSGGVIEYHYQNLDNIITYFKKLHKKKQLRSGYSQRARSGSDGISGSKPIKGEKTILKHFKSDINFFPTVDHSLIQVDIPKETNNPAERVEGIYTDINKFKENLKKFNVKRFTPITINNLLPLPSGQIENHANMIIIDNVLQQVELFEPHGYKPENCDNKSSSNAYYTKIKSLEAFFKNEDLDSSDYKISEYKFIAAADFVQKEGFQALFDSNSGYCVTWSALYCHYRILNPDVPVNTLIDYLDESIAKTNILRYAKNIEDIIKKK